MKVHINRNLYKSLQLPYNESSHKQKSIQLFTTTAKTAMKVDINKVFTKIFTITPKTAMEVQIIHS